MNDEEMTTKEMPKDVEETLNKIYEEKGGENYVKQEDVNCI